MGVGAGDRHIRQVIGQNGTDNPLPLWYFLDFINEDIPWLGHTLKRSLDGLVQVCIVFYVVPFEGFLVDVQEGRRRHSPSLQVLDQQSHDAAFANSAHACDHFDDRLVDRG